MRRAVQRRVAVILAAPAAFVVLGVVPAFADEPPATTVPAEPVATTVLDDVEVGVAEALLPPVVATVEVPAERTATTVVDGVEVGVGEALAPPTTATSAPPAAPDTTVAEPAPAPAERALAEDATVALVLAAWG